MATIEWVNEAYVSAVEANDAAEVYERQIELLETRQRVQVRNARSIKGEPIDTAHASCRLAANAAHTTSSA